MTNENWQSRGYFSEDLCPSELRGSPFGEVRVNPLDELLELFPDTPENKKKWAEIRKMTEEMRDNFDGVNPRYMATAIGKYPFVSGSLFGTVTIKAPDSSHIEDKYKIAGKIASKEQDREMIRIALHGAKLAKTQVLKNNTKGKENLMNTILSTAYKKNGIIGAAIIIFLAAAAFVLLFTFLGLWAGGVI